MCWLKNKSIAKIMIWLVAEILLNCLGIDDLADYSEFVFKNNKDEKLIIELVESGKLANTNNSKSLRLL